MKLNDNMVFNILSTLCPDWDSIKSDSGLSELTKRDIYYNSERTSCYVELPTQLAHIECDFKNDLLVFGTNWDTRGDGIYNLKEVLPELVDKSKSQPKSKKRTNYIEELLTKYGRGNNETTD